MDMLGIRTIVTYFRRLQSNAHREYMPGSRFTAKLVWTQCDWRLFGGATNYWCNRIV